MTLQELRYVVTLADHGHFGRAAVACHISQPTLSTQIKKLEAELGVQLFERTSKSVFTTPFGQEVAERGRQILADVEAIVTIGRRAATPLAGPFGLGVIPTLGPYLLPWLVPALRAAYPDLRLAVREDITDHILDALVAHRLDAALLALPITDDRVETLPLFDEPFWYAQSAAHAPALTPALTPVSLDTLHGARLLLLTEGHCLRDQALALCGPQPAAQSDFRATSLETIRQMVAIGMGATLLPALACTVPNDAISLAPLEGDLGRRIALVWRRGYAKAGDIQLLATTIRRNLPGGVTPADSSTQSVSARQSIGQAKPRD